MPTNSKPKPTADILTGQFFHSFCEEDSRLVKWQGAIRGKVAEGLYLCLLYSWGMGEPTHSVLVKTDAMAGWHFYPDDETMRNAWSRVHRAYSYQKSDDAHARKTADEAWKRYRAAEMAKNGSANGNKDCSLVGAGRE